MPRQGGEIVSAAHLVRPAPEWKIREAWNLKAERLHGISLAQLLAHGAPAHAVANDMNDRLAGLELFSDESAYDRRWLGQLFKVAGVEPTFTVSLIPTRALLGGMAEERGFDPARFEKLWEEARQQRRHRADADARAYAEIWRQIAGDAEK